MPSSGSSMRSSARAEPEPEPPAAARARPQGRGKAASFANGFARLGRSDLWLPRLVVAPSFAASLFFVYGFILWTVSISFTRSGVLPCYEFAGVLQYVRLWNTPRWYIALDNLVVFASLFILGYLAVVILLAILLDQRIRIEGTLRTIYLYPMALSFIVTGTAWKWILNPGLGIERVAHDLGFESFTFDWLVNREMAIYTVVLSSGYVMALFLRGRRWPTSG